MKMPATSPLRLAITLFTVLAFSAGAIAEDKQSDAQTTQSPKDSKTEMKTTMTPELLWQMGRLGDVALSPDGSQIAYTVKHYSLEENAGTTTLYIMDLSQKNETSVIEDWDSIGSIQWSSLAGDPQIFFEGKTKSETTPDESTKGETTDESANAGQTVTQAWVFNVANKETTQITSIKDGISNLKVSPNGKRIAFTVRVKMKQEVKDIFPDLPKADARIIDSLMYRHWNTWDDYKFSHIHVAELNSDQSSGDALDLMDGIEADCPVGHFGGSEQFDWSPDGTKIAFTMKNITDGTKWAQSTDSNVYVIDVKQGATPKLISDDMAGYDRNPVYSPDGNFIAFSSMKRAGFEADRARVMIYDVNSEEISEATKGLDQNAHQTIWSDDSKSILFTSESLGTQQIYKLEVSQSQDAEGRELQQITQGRYNWSLIAANKDGDTIYAKRSDMLRPDEIYKIEASNANPSQITTINDAIYEKLDLPTIEERFVTATDGKKIQTWVIYPADLEPNGFDPFQEQPRPMLLYCQGGPQAQVGQNFSWRWNFHLMAAQGYIVAAPNRRGLPGFGQKWNDDISGDWGGQAMQDLIAVADDVASENYVDNDRLAAVGASFGGYSIYWLMGHHEDRFKAMIAHCGVFNLESMYGSTEELFFVNWDMGGPYWASEELKSKYQDFSPHQFVKNWDTPLLVIHGQQDFRVPVTQGMEAFTVAQVQNVPSRFLYFPDEGHWVTSPQNSVLWHRVFFDWLQRYCEPSEKN